MLEKKTLGLGIALTLALAGTAAAGDAEPEGPQFIGAKKCAKMCHNAEDEGAQYDKWLAGPHSKAYATLGTDKAKEIAAGKGIEDPQKAADCLKCHVTAHGEPPERLAKTFAVEDGVGCESCHGAGSAYKKLKVMKDPEKAKAAGLVHPNEETCAGCHNEENPTFTPFDFAERYAKIAHENPKTAKK